MAEAFLRHVGGEYFEAFSAGAHPDFQVHPQALETLRRNHVPVDGLAAKSVSTFTGQAFEFVISLCDREKEQPSVMPGADMIYWTFADPALPAEAKAQARAFEDVFRGLERRIRLLIVVNTRRSASALHTSPSQAFSPA